MKISSSAAVYVISVAAELAGMHPQTLRQYDRMGLVTPQRTAGRGRRYSADDIEKLRLIQRLSQEEGINLAGIARILDLHSEVTRTRERMAEMQTELEAARRRLAAVDRVFAAGSGGDVVSIVHGKRPSTRIAGALGPGARSESTELAPYRYTR